MHEELISSIVFSRFYNYLQETNIYHHQLSSMFGGSSKREAVNAIVNTLNKPASAFFSAFNRPTGSPCCHNLLRVTPSYHSKVTPIGALHTEQIAGAVLLYVFRIAFSTSLL